MLDCAALEADGGAVAGEEELEAKRVGRAVGCEGGEGAEGAICSRSISRSDNPASTSSGVATLRRREEDSWANRSVR